MSRPRGIVSRVGLDLHVAVPGLDGSTWQLLVGAATPLGPAVDDEARVIIFPASASPRVRGFLDVWPATKVAWEWSDNATKVSNAVQNTLSVVGDLANTRVVDQAAWPADIDLKQVGFVRELRPFQCRDAARLIRSGGGCNFSVPGSGKTTVAYAVWSAERLRSNVEPMLVIAPASAFEAWGSEATACFAPGSRPKVEIRPVSISRDADVVVLNYEKLEQRRVLAEIDAWVGNRGLLVCFDEAHRVKAGRRGTRGGVALELARRAASTLVLTGTPMPNSTSDLVAVVDLAWPGFGTRVATGDLRASRDRLFVRTTKSELELPPLEIRVEKVQLEPAHRRVYSAMLGEELARTQAGGDAAEMGKAVMRLIAAATNPAAVFTPGQPWMLSPRDDDAALRELVTRPMEHLRPAKIVRAAQIVRANASDGRKTLLWSNFVDNVRLLREALGSYSPAVITGATPVEDPAAPTDRVRELARFRQSDECQVLIATPQTLGEGVSLHRTCFDQVHVDRGYAAGTFLQSIDRTHRLGMADDTSPTCTVLIAAGTIDERIAEVLAAKIDRMGAALDDTDLKVLALPNTPINIDLSSLLLEDASSSELEDLLGGLRPHTPTPRE